MINNSTSSSVALFYGSPDNSSSESPSYPRPEQAIQYYRASTLVLTLDGYNDTSIFNTSTNTSSGSSDSNNTATPLPTLGTTDQLFIQCLNDTIGEAVPLVDTAWSMRLGVLGGGTGGSASVVLTIWLLVFLKQWFGFF